MASYSMGSRWQSVLFLKLLSSTLTAMRVEAASAEGWKAIHFAAHKFGHD
jgi:hypothetical protein